MIINWDETKDVFPKVETDEIITKAHKNDISEWLEKFQDLHGYGIRAGFDTLKDRLADFYNHGVRYLKGRYYPAASVTKYVLDMTTRSNPGEHYIILHDAGEVSELSMKVDPAVAAGSQIKVQLYKNGEATSLYDFMSTEDGTDVKVMTSGHFSVAEKDILEFMIQETKGVAPNTTINVSAKVINS